MNNFNCIICSPKNFPIKPLKHQNPEIGYSLELKIFGYEYEKCEITSYYANFLLNFYKGEYIYEHIEDIISWFDDSSSDPNPYRSQTFKIDKMLFLGEFYAFIINNTKDYNKDHKEFTKKYDK